MVCSNIASVFYSALVSLQLDAVLQGVLDLLALDNILKVKCTIVIYCLLSNLAARYSRDLYYTYISTKAPEFVRGQGLKLILLALEYIKSIALL